MKLGINTHFIMKFDFEAGLKFCQGLGIKAVEIAATGPSASRYCDVDRLLADTDERERWLEAYASHSIEIYSFSGHGTPLVPDKEIAAEYSRQFRQACRLMEMIGCTRMALVAGLPEGAEGDRLPAWIINTDLPFLRDALAWQWEKRLIPYWKEHGKIAADHGVTLCFEMQVNDMIHSPVKLRRLHDEIGAVVACNFDISHMWAQGIDPFEAMHYLGDLIQNVHLKDTLIHEPNMRLRGFCDSTGLEGYRDRSWTFTIPGWGHDERTWREVITTLRFLNYEGILSLEMESEYIEIQEGLEKAAAFIKPMLLQQPPGPAWWQVTSVHELWKDPKEKP
jgi:sugar phosphate isomerase/epimerase